MMRRQLKPWLKRDICGYTAVERVPCRHCIGAARHRRNPARKHLLAKQESRVQYTSEMRALLWPGVYAHFMALPCALSALPTNPVTNTHLATMNSSSISTRLLQCTALAL